MKKDALLSYLKKAIASAPHRAVVDDLRVFSGSDADGDDAVFVTVVLKDLKSGDYRWSDVQPLTRWLRAQVNERAPDKFPYIDFVLKSEAVGADAHALG